MGAGHPSFSEVGAPRRDRMGSDHPTGSDGITLWTPCGRSLRASRSWEFLLTCVVCAVSGVGCRVSSFKGGGGAGGPKIMADPVSGALQNRVISHLPLLFTHTQRCSYKTAYTHTDTGPVCASCPVQSAPANATATAQVERTRARINPITCMAGVAPHHCPAHLYRTEMRDTVVSAR